MKRERFHALMCGLIIAAFAILLMVPAKSAYAANDTLKYAKKLVVIYGGLDNGSSRYYYLDMGSKIKNASEVTVDSGNSSIVMANAYQFEEGGNYNISLNIRGKGTTKLTIKMRKSGAVKTYKSTIKAVKYENPVKTFKIGTKNYSPKFKKADMYGSVKFPAGKKKISVKAAKNWKIKKIEVFGNTEGSYVGKKAKNNASFDFSKFESVRDVIVTLTNKKTKAVETVDLAAY